MNTFGTGLETLWQPQALGWSEAAGALNTRWERIGNMRPPEQAAGKSVTAAMGAGTPVWLHPSQPETGDSTEVRGLVRSGHAKGASYAEIVVFLSLLKMYGSLTSCTSQQNF